MNVYGVHRGYMSVRIDISNNDLSNIIQSSPYLNVLVAGMTADYQLSL